MRARKTESVPLSMHGIHHTTSGRPALNSRLMLAVLWPKSWILLSWMCMRTRPSPERLIGALTSNE